ncbi:MAG: hypothetical protein V2I45_09450, partial [Halieaceae bacterium]|nr:hypothetical protein [Halieaceae bacterium]
MITKVQQMDWETEGGQQQLFYLINRVLKTQRFCRDAKQPVNSPIVEEINHRLRSHLYQNLIDLLRQHPQRSLAAALEVKVPQTYQTVFDNPTLTRLGCAAQALPPNSEPRRQALNDLIEAIKLSEKLSNSRCFEPNYEEAIALTLSHVYQKIDQYDAARAPLMAWVNYWLGIFLQQVEQTEQDPFARAHMGKRIRTKAKLKRHLRQVKTTSLWLWLRLAIVSGPTAPLVNPAILLVWCVWLSAQMRQCPDQADALLLALVDRLLFPPVAMAPLDDRDIPVSADQPPSLSEQIRQYIRADPCDRCQVHIQDRPDVT